MATCVGCEKKKCICETPPRIKCEFRAPCTTLENRLNDLNAKYHKGLSVLVLTNMKKAAELGGPGEASWLAAITYRTSSKDNGLVLNYCPWCGENLELWLKSPWS